MCACVGGWAGECVRARVRERKERRCSLSFHCQGAQSLVIITQLKVQAAHSKQHTPSCRRRAFAGDTINTPTVTEVRLNNGSRKVVVHRRHSVESLWRRQLCEQTIGTQWFCVALASKVGTSGLENMLKLFCTRVRSM